MLYSNLKYLHFLCALVSGALFALRAYWHLWGHPLHQARWVRIVPHVVDTVLLASAIGLLWVTAMNPAAHPWLMAKLALLLVYIGFGMVAMRSRGPRAIRALWFASAMGIFLAIGTIALTKQIPFVNG